MNVIELLILAAAADHVQDYGDCLQADMAFDGGEFSGSHEYHMPLTVAVSIDLLTANEALS